MQSIGKAKECNNKNEGAKIRMWQKTILKHNRIPRDIRYHPMQFLIIPGRYCGCLYRFGHDDSNFRSECLIEYKDLEDVVSYVKNFVEGYQEYITHLFEKYLSLQ